MRFKKQFLILTLGLIYTTRFVFADGNEGNKDIDLADVSAETVKGPTSPFSANIVADVIGNAEIKEGFFEKDYVQFAEGEVELDFVFYFCKAYSEGLQLALSYTPTYIHWENNPWFEQDKFQIASITLNAFSKRLYKWFWKGQLVINVDAQQWDFNDYTFYDALLWGRYEYSKPLGINIGLIVETGMKMDRVYPILGIDWQVARKWKLNLVFPVNVSLDYQLTKNWIVAVAGRNFNTRVRVGPHESHPKFLIRYQNVGAEVAVRYETPKVTANVHGGTTLGGKLRIADEDNHHPHRFKLRPAGYFGAEVTSTF